MRKFYAFAFLLALTLAAQFCATLRPAAAANRRSRVGADAADVRVGEIIEDFKLPDASSGRVKALSALRGAKGTVLIFISVQCPVSNAYNERIEKLASDYRARGVNVIGINANATESAEDVKQHAAAKNLTFTILKDKGNKIADRLGAQVTPEAFFLDASGKLVYRGRIDNSRAGTAITANDLREAIEATLAGQPVAKSEARAFGCSIKRAS